MKNLAIVFVSLLVLSCSIKDSGLGTVESTLIGKGNLLGAGNERISKQNTIVTNQSEWDNLIHEMNSVNNVSDSFSETTIDFSKYKVIAVFGGVQETGNYNIELDVFLNIETVVVEIKKVTVNTDKITQPYHILKIPISDGLIVFQE